ncbi:MAG: hypothetical protein ACI4V1_01665 [Eubacteriales bacterium]
MAVMEADAVAGLWGKYRLLKKEKGSQWSGKNIDEGCPLWYDFPRRFFLRFPGHGRRKPEDSASGIKREVLGSCKIIQDSGTEGMEWTSGIGTFRKLLMRLTFASKVKTMKQ